MGLYPFIGILRNAAVVIAVAGMFTGPTSLEAGTVPPAGLNWQIVNDVFAEAVRQQSIQNRGFLPDRAFQSHQTQTAPAPAVAPVMQKSAKLAAKVPAGTTETAQMQEASDGKWGWLSEIRLGVLKHSVPISTSTPKEKGIDGNVEVLFTSPGWLGWMWSPRPHIGASFNASSDDTDMAYSGLTWEWQPFGNFFIDASLGFAVHNGRLHVDGADEDSGRRREFGCKALFRESIEFGYRIKKRHSLSAIWDHVSHGGLCDDENEGMDNAGLRYGYKY